MHVRTGAAIMRVARYALVSVALYAYVILQQAIPHVFMMLFGNKTVLTYRHARNAPHRAPTSYRLRGGGMNPTPKGGKTKVEAAMLGKNELTCFCLFLLVVALPLRSITHVIDGGMRMI